MDSHFSLDQLDAAPVIGLPIHGWRWILAPQTPSFRSLFLLAS